MPLQFNIEFKPGANPLEVSSFGTHNTGKLVYLKYVRFNI